MKNIIDANSYKIIIESGSLDKIGEYATEEVGVCRAMIVSDDKVHSLYGKAVRDSLTRAGYELCPDFIFLHGEKSKNFTVFAEIVRAAAENKLTRKDVIFALGGGVAGDMAGFASAVYLRGIKYVSIPTSLLAMVDSSVGGKTAIDIPEGKNLVGAFHMPSLVLSDPNLLGTLDDDFLYDGMAEVIKYGMLGNRGLFELLEAEDVRGGKISLSANLGRVISECVTDKRDIVSRDFMDKGERQKLNLGHTFGHGIELLSNFGVSHGHAVASGMYLITKCAVKAGLCPSEVLGRLESVTKKFGLDPFIYENYKFEALLDAASHDKKLSGDNITLVVPRDIGECELRKMKFTNVRDFVSAGFER